MESKAKILGHPIHPMLIVFPLGLLGGAVVFDVLYLILNTPILETVAFYMIIAGIVGGLLAAVFGLIDWLALPPNTRAKGLGLWHGLGNVLVVGLFAASWLLRLDNPNFLPDTLAMTLSFLGIGLALITWWIGGELVYRLSVGVDPGANVNAPSSLEQEPPVSGITTKRTTHR